ncbi:O-antigen ligase family protein [Pelagibacterales bacterium SAG-MED35]|nr:O-antigen ligase family protein [Pelagibacterales bacterium SAG-MED35]
MSTYSLKNIFNPKINFFFFLLCLYPWFLISGPFLSDTIAIILSIYYLFVKIKDRNLKDFNNAPFIIFCVFCLYILLNSIIIAQNLVSIKSALFFFRFGLFSLAVCFLLSENQKKIKYFFFNFTLALILLFIDSIFQKLLGFNLIGIEMQSIRVSSFFGDELILGSFVIKIFPIVLAFLYSLYSEKANKFSLAVIFMSIIPVVLSAEKASFALMFLFLFLFLLIINFNIKIKFLILLFIFLTSSSLVILNKPIQKRLYHDLLSNSGGGKFIYSQMHDSHFRTAFKMFLDKPILGHGPKMYRFKCNDKSYKINELSCSTHPHNFILQILSEIGIIGFIFMLLFYGSLLKIFFRNLKEKKSNKDFYYMEYILTSSLLVIFFPLATSGNLFNNWISCLHFLNIGILIYFMKSNQNKIV